MADPLSKRFRRLVFGPEKKINQKTFHSMALIAVFAWVGLGADGLTSSCYGPEEAYRALGIHTPLGIFVALAAALTIFTISLSYSQLLEAFPTGGGGYLVASKLLSPTAGMISGTALVIDYVLTITVSIASGADALFSALPSDWITFKLAFEFLIMGLLLLMNLRGVKESILPLIPIFAIFVLTHAVLIGSAFGAHLDDWGHLAQSAGSDLHNSVQTLGWIGALLLILKAFTMGAGTFTGIEAVSNGMSVLREPRVSTGKRTMFYMALSLSVTVVGLFAAYILFDVKPQDNITLNAVLVGATSKNWGSWGPVFGAFTLGSEAVLLFVAAQTGFIGGPQVVANMAKDRWLPTRFAALSDRLVSKNGLFLMAIGASVVLFLTNGSVETLVILYSINVFITFVLSQLGMIIHWFRHRHEARHWLRKMIINGFGLVVSAFILISVVTLKFAEGGWVTMLVTTLMALGAWSIRRYYQKTGKRLARLNILPQAVLKELEVQDAPQEEHVRAEGKARPGEGRTAVLLVSGFNGMGLHTFFQIPRLFPGAFRRVVFVEIGLIDAGNFKGMEAIEELKESTARDLSLYQRYAQKHDWEAYSYSGLSTDVLEEFERLLPVIQKDHPEAVYFAGKLVFDPEPFLSHWLFNNLVEELQRRCARQGMPFVVMPVRA
jgi:amino acid transporter